MAAYIEKIKRHIINNSARDLFNENADKKKVDRLSLALKQNLIRRKTSKIVEESED